MPRVSLLLACAVLLAGCGGGEPTAAVTELPTTTATSPTFTAQLTQDTPGPVAPAPSTGSDAATSGPQGTTGSGAANPGGASPDTANPGGASAEEPVRQPARFALGSVSLTPASISVAPGLPIALSVVNQDEGFHAVKLVGTDVAFTVQGGQTERRTLPGLAAGMYTLSVDGGKQASVLVVGDSAGP